MDTIHAASYRQDKSINSRYVVSWFERMAIGQLGHGYSESPDLIFGEELRNSQSSEEAANMAANDIC
jgi:hypothetical protein